MQQILSHKETESILDDSFKMIQRICRSYNQGILSKQEFNNYITNIIHAKVITEYLGHKKGVFLLFNTKSYETFCSEYKAWHSGGFSEKQGAEPWLFYDGQGDAELSRRMAVYCSVDKCKNLWTPSGTEDKKIIFHLLNSFRIPPEYFKPLPDGLVKPEMYNTHVYANVSKYVIEFQCVDDGGLSQDSHPEGKEYILTSDLGLKAKLRILEVRSTEDQKVLNLDADDFAPLGAYLGIGYIEGYTLKREREIVVRTAGIGGKIKRLGTCFDFDDYNIGFRKYPLWKEYFKASNKWYERQQKILDNILEYFRKCAALEKNILSEHNEAP